MATVREGKKAILMVVDVQVGVMKDAWDAPRIVENVARTVERARTHGVPVVWVQHSDELAQLGASHIVLAGAATNWCIRATAYAALDRGYDLTLVKDAHTTETMRLDDGTTIEAADVVRELNIAMTWLEYPGRKNSTATADEVDFTATDNAAR